MAMSTMDNASAQLAIALQLHDLNELEALGTVDKAVIHLQRQQLEIDSGFDEVTFEASWRLAVSMAKAVEDDSALLARSTPLQQIDDATYERLSLLNHAIPTSSNGKEPATAPLPKGNLQTVPSKVGGLKRARSVTPEDDLATSIHKKSRGEGISSGQHPTTLVEDDSIEPNPVQDPQHHIVDVSNAHTIEVTTPTDAVDTSTSTADCVICSDVLPIDKLVKAPCGHFYCKDCFGQFVEASLSTQDAFPPTCCKIPVSFTTVVDNVSPAVYTRYSARQAEIKNASALYCGVQKCSVKIEKSMVAGDRATCAACFTDTCTLCRGTFPRDIKGKKLGHVCKKDEEREQVLALAKREGWQTCYQCSNLVALNYGCHHMR